MADSKLPETNSTGPTQLNLVNSGRLQALRKQSGSPLKDEGRMVDSPQFAEPNPKEDAQTAQLRRQVYQRLQAILAGLPAGKQRSLFKIRYGVALDELEKLPVQQVAALLKIGPTIHR
ncbi:MAG: hypothetical protein ACXV7J_01660 [Methylomonas sp.]